MFLTIFRNNNNSNLYIFLLLRCLPGHKCIVGHKVSTWSPMSHFGIKNRCLSKLPSQISRRRKFTHSGANPRLPSQINLNFSFSCEELLCFSSWIPRYIHRYQCIEIETFVLVDTFHRIPGISPHWIQMYMWTQGVYLDTNV